MRALFNATQGQDPIFNVVDASNCGTAIDTSTLEGRIQAYSLLLKRGLVRTAIAVPATAEFQVTNTAINMQPTAIRPADTPATWRFTDVRFPLQI